MKIAVEIADDDVREIRQFLKLSNLSEANTHGQLTLELLAEMLLQDVALVVRRPGCWEASNMHSVLASHGYETITPTWAESENGDAS